MFRITLVIALLCAAVGAYAQSIAAATAKRPSRTLTHKPLRVAAKPVTTLEADINALPEVQLPAVAQPLPPAIKRIGNSATAANNTVSRKAISTVTTTKTANGVQNTTTVTTFADGAVSRTTVTKYAAKTTTATPRMSYQKTIAPRKTTTTPPKTVLVANNAANKNRTEVTPTIKRASMTTGANASNSFTTTQLAAANTGLSAPYLRANEREVLQLINLARADGNLFLKQYGDRYIAATPAFQHNRYAQSLYTDLRRIKGLPPLQPSFKLAKSATAHAQDIGTHGLQSHTSSNGCKYDQRISRFIGSPYVALGENISYGKDHNQALPIVMNLLIDNNNEALGHRRNILSPTFESIGIAIQAHQKHGFTCVQDYAAGIE